MLRLLVVDGEESIRFSMKEYFTLQGYKVDAAGDREEAEKLIENHAYDVVVQDLAIGPTQKLDGLEVIKFVRNRDSRTLIVVLTAYGSPEIQKAALDFGADAFLRKPQPLSQVAQVIQGLIAAHPTHYVHRA